MAEHGEELILGQVRPGLFLQLLVRLLQLRGKRLRLLEQVLRARICFDRMQNDADAFRELIEKRLVRWVETLER